MPDTFDYHQPVSLDEAIALLDRYGDEDAHAIAGGTSLVLLMKQGLVQPRHVVSLRGIPGLRGIRRSADGALEIGALTTHRELERSSEARAFCPALAEMAGHVATVRIRNQATLGGNLVHADPAQDPPPMLLALDAEVTLAGEGGTRTVPLTDFFVDYFETAVRAGEVLVNVRVPEPVEGTRATYLKFLPRTRDDYATVAVAVRLRLSADSLCEDVGIGLGSVATVPLRARAAEDALRGERLTSDRLREVAALVRDEVDPLDDVRGTAAYKREMARVWTERALRRLVDPPPVEQPGRNGQRV